MDWLQGGKGIEAKVIGSDFGTRTEIISGIDWEIEENLKILRDQIEKTWGESQQTRRNDSSIPRCRPKTGSIPWALKNVN